MYVWRWMKNITCSVFKIKYNVSVQYLNRYEILAHKNSQSEGLKSCKTRICQANPRVCSEQLQYNTIY